MNSRTIFTAVGASVLVLALASTGMVAVTQHSTAVDACADTRSVSKDLAENKTQLSDAEADLANPQLELGNANSQLGVCADGVQAARHLYDASSTLVDALPASGFGVPDVGLFDSATADIEGVSDIIDRCEYDHLHALLDSCDGVSPPSADS